MEAIITRSRAYERQVLEERLRLTKPGEVVSYSDLGRDLELPLYCLRGLVYSVRRILNTDGFVFEAVAKTGLRRLTDADIAVLIPVIRRRKINRQAEIGSKEMAALTSTDGLTEEQKMTAMIGRSLLGAIYAVTTRKAVEAIGQSVTKVGHTLSVEATINAFKDIR